MFSGCSCLERFTVKLRSNILEELHMLELNSLHDLFRVAICCIH